ncbi:hypothetical protein EKH57_08890 [Halorubrum sp. BOL3-1]|uniref:hypothetical protein n=1 Tax=Halorubrum sp. BOL3-1 TaxID=2497325 RepID=UPI0010050582|nr:hypothetical protein [Halorubrum sp. BOL3-1]QAU12833.1 hypothetical protein EKH57_08890 [Halorubrum sp. BOL3-1]
MEQIANHYESGAESVAVQGPISSMKTWLLTCTDEEFVSDSKRPVILTPQRVNRQDVVERLDTFGVPYVERPGRKDLCAWNEWRDSVQRVDERICSTNGCDLYPDDGVEEAAREALESHKLHQGDLVQLDQERVQDLAAQQDVCPHYLLEALRDLVDDERPTELATYAKALMSDDWSSSDVALLDESHAVGTSADPRTAEINLPAISDAVEEVNDFVQGSAREALVDARHDIKPFAGAIEAWKESSEARTVTPDELFEGTDATLGDAFQALEKVRPESMSDLKRAVVSGATERVEETRARYDQLRDVVEFLAQVQSYRDGESDFVHTRYEAQGEAVNEMAFRQVTDSQPATETSDIYDAWRDEGTHPAIEDRWGGLLDHHIEEVWDGRHVEPGGDRDRPGVPRGGLSEIRAVTDADTLVGYSATHSELSDPARSPDDLRQTAHQLVTAPLRLRSDGDDSHEFDGRESVDADTPWFQNMIRRAKEQTDARLAAVPINTRNGAKWEAMPVRKLDLPDHGGGTEHVSGLVPNSRGAIGDMGLEDLPIDAVLCGVQVQSPSATARRLVSFWELLAADHDDPTEALQAGWRLLAQHAVSGTIQAAGRFRPEATNIVFERPELVELAGFECDRLSASMGGFAGALAREIEQAQSEYRRRRAPVRAAKVVGHLEQADSKAPTKNQYLSKYQDVYGADEAEATEAAFLAAEDGRIEFGAGTFRLKSALGSGPEGPG